jgi:predicted HTH transcriptional regulator
LTYPPLATPLPINIDDILHGQTVGSERLEFKQGWNPEAVLHTMCAFANDFHNLGGGYIFIGVAENQGQLIKEAKERKRLATGQVTGQVVAQILQFCEQPRKAGEIHALVSVKHRQTFRKKLSQCANRQRLAWANDSRKTPKSVAALPDHGRREEVVAKRDQSNPNRINLKLKADSKRI